MGATVSCSSPASATLLVPIPEYSKLLRVPGRTIEDLILFRGLRWDVKVKATAQDQGDVNVIAEYLQLQVRSRNAQRDNVIVGGVDMSIEILDDTGEHTVFHRESSRGSCEEKHGYLMLRVHRRELEASSCVRRDDDSLTVRYTLKEQPKTKSKRHRRLLGLLSKKKKQQLPAVSEVSLAASHALAVGSLSELKAALLSGQCTYSTRFAVGGGSWYLALFPSRAAVHLPRATKDDDRTRTVTEFSFVFEGAVNVQSQKMRHTFDHARPYYKFEYQQPPEEEPNTSSTSTDSLVVRCCVTVISAAEDPTAVDPPQSVLTTPLLSPGPPAWLTN